MISGKIFNSYANRGMALENDINLTNKYYLDNDIAIIHKKPTPIKVSKVCYPNSHSVVIKEAFYEMGSLTDLRHEYYSIAVKPDEHGMIEVIGDMIQVNSGVH